ncbi:unnamed protein product [Symbiodinium microadriaticum]|nr:unnamed protein product [Symbiodinium microadriaticum]
MDSEQLTKQVERHIDTLRSIRSKLEERVELKARIGDYRDWKRDFMEKKTAVMSGKTLQDASSSSPQLTQDLNTTHPTAGGGRDLATVLDSLNKLAQLEQRITSLEREGENIYDKMKASEAQKTSLDFKKKRAADPLARASGKPGGMRAVYAVRAKKVPLSKGVRLPVQRGGPRGGTFLTSVEESNRDARQRERQRQLALATAGQKNLRERVRTKKTRVAKDLSSNQKHEEALADLNKRRSEQAARMKAKRTAAIVGKGASSGRKFKSKHMEDFQLIKKQHRAKREERAGAGNTRQSATAQPTSQYVSSTTMPAIGKASKRAPRAPSTKTAGTITRRTNTVPVRRGGGVGARSGSQKMPAIVVAGSGVGGVRGLKQQRQSGGTGRSSKR